MPSLYLLGEQYISRVYIRLKYRSVVGISQKKKIIYNNIKLKSMRTVLYGNCAVLYQFCLPFVKQRWGIDGILNEITKIVNNFVCQYVLPATVPNRS